MIISDKKVKGVEKHTASAKGTDFSLKQKLKTIDNPVKKDDNNKQDYYTGGVLITARYRIKRGESLV